MNTYTERFSVYLTSHLAQKAASTLSDGILIAFKISETSECFVFTKQNGKNLVLPDQNPEQNPEQAW